MFAMTINRQHHRLIVLSVVGPRNDAPKPPKAVRVEKSPRNRGPPARKASRQVSHQICAPQDDRSVFSKVHVVNGVPARGVQPFAAPARLVRAVVSVILRSLESGTVPRQSMNRIARVAVRRFSLPPEFDLTEI